MSGWEIYVITLQAVLKELECFYFLKSRKSWKGGPEKLYISKNTQ